MATITWQNESSYSCGDTERVPSVLVKRCGSVEVYVHRHIDYPGDWLTSIKVGRGYVVEKKVLSSKTLEAAQAEALGLLRAWKRKFVADATTLLGDD